MGQIGNDENSSLNELPSEIYQLTLKDIIRNNFDSPPEACNIVIEAGSAKGDNYIGILYRCKIRDPKGNKLNVIIKASPTNPARREQFYARPSFLRESEFYDTVLPMYRKFQEEKGIDVEKDGFYQVPSCYKSLTEEPFEGLFLEDLKVTGFEMFDRFKDVTVDHVYRVMESLGKLHALSFAIKDQKPELIAPFNKLKDNFLPDESVSKTLRMLYDSMKKLAAQAINEISNENLKQKANKFLEYNWYETIEPCVNGVSAEPYAVICHGDCWSNNILYRLENNVPVEVRLLDWQLMRYASPVTDVVYYIFVCTTKALRDKHYNDFLDVYYKSLSSFLTRLGSNPSKVFPREAFDDHLKRFGKYGLSTAILMLPVVTSKAEDTPDLDEISGKYKEASEDGTKFEENSVDFISPGTNNGYNERMNDVFQDMYDLKYI